MTTRIVRSDHYTRVVREARVYDKDSSPSYAKLTLADLRALVTEADTLGLPDVAEVFVWGVTVRDYLYERASVRTMYVREEK